MRISTRFIVLTLAAACVFSGAASATSFDCSKASTYSEIQICNNPQLQRQDEQLNSAYVVALGNASDKAALRFEQRNWLKQRDSCQTVECVSRSMVLRIASLSNQTSPDAATRPQHAAPSQEARQATGTPSLKTDAWPAHNRAPSAVVETKKSAQAEASRTERSTDELDVRTLKIVSFVMAVILLICIWLHSRGSMVIYSCYTDALWTTMTPFFSVAAYFIARSWLELSTDIALVSAAVVAGLMSLQIVIQTFRSNGVSLYFLLALYAKMVLFSIYFLSMGALLLGGGRTAAERRRRRNLALGGSVLFAALTSWMCRNRQFSHIDDYIAGRT